MAVELSRWCKITHCRKSVTRIRYPLLPPNAGRDDLAKHLYICELIGKHNHNAIDKQAAVFFGLIWGAFAAAVVAVIGAYYMGAQ